MWVTQSNSKIIRGKLINGKISGFRIKTLNTVSFGNIFITMLQTKKQQLVRKLEKNKSKNL